MDALKKEDVNALEQTKNALLASSTEGLKKMSPISTYNGDKSLKVACERLLEFYMYEATKSADLADLYLKRDNFEKSKKALESKKPADRTQQDVDAFNKLVADFNASVAKFNQLNTELNKKRSEALSSWNKAADNFLDSHVPTHR
jgi:wobble nucleotide-excising tRNase